LSKPSNILGYQSYAKSSKFWPLKPFYAIDIQKIKHWEKYYWQTCSRLITMSQNDKDFIQAECPDIKQIDVVANGVDTEFFDAMPKKLPKDPTILICRYLFLVAQCSGGKYLVKDVWPLIQKKCQCKTAHCWV
jgi:glycosyltransferase involved in cell wall biosynthesis